MSNGRHVPGNPSDVPAVWRLEGCKHTVPHEAIRLFAVWGPHSLPEVWCTRCGGFKRAITRGSNPDNRQETLL